MNSRAKRRWHIHGGAKAIYRNGRCIGSIVSTPPTCLGPSWAERRFTSSASEDLKVSMHIHNPDEPCDVPTYECTATGSRLSVGRSHTWDLRNPDDVRFLFGSFDEDEVADVVREATEAANLPPAPPWVVTDINEKTRTVTIETLGDPVTITEVVQL